MPPSPCARSPSLDYKPPGKDCRASELPASGAELSSSDCGPPGRIAEPGLRRGPDYATSARTSSSSRSRPSTASGPL
eukprot:6322519-Alexandrium_andersonii.AAC.1